MITEPSIDEHNKITNPSDHLASIGNAAGGHMGPASSPASSPNKHLSSLRSVAPAAALVFLALVFVAGAISTLHYRGGVAVDDDYWDSAVVSSASSPPPRKMLRDGGCRGQLPRGVVRETTDLEMEASLAGDPRRQQDPPARRKSLLAVPVGIKNKAVVDRLVSKFLAAGDGEEEFAVTLFHYDGAVEQWGDLPWSSRAVHVAARGQTKWWFAKRFLHADVVAPYEYVFLWDEDVEVDAFDPARYLAAVRREGLAVSQPALDRASEIHHAFTARAAAAPGEGGGVRRGAGWVEMMVPVFSREAWRCAWRMVQNDLVNGWGLDFKLGYCAPGDRARTVGVVDSEYVLHRGVPKLGGGAGKGRAAVRWRSFKEMRIFEKRWEKAAAEDESWTDPYAAQPPAGSDR